jgi:hypothetical protein
LARFQVCMNRRPDLATVVTVYPGLERGLLGVDPRLL